MEFVIVALGFCILGVVIVAANVATSLLGLWLSQQKWYAKMSAKAGRRVADETIKLMDIMYKDNEKEP